MRRREWLLALAAVAALAPAGARAAPPASLTVFAASDLALAFKDIVPRFEAAHGAKAVVVLGSTGNLAKQIEEGAPADLFFAANVAFVDRLAASGAVLPDTRALYARGRAVLVAPKGAAVAVRSLADLARPEVRRVAIANPEHAPYGQAAKEALEAAGLWEAVRGKLVYGENVRQALQFVQSGAVDAGIVALSIAGVPEIERVLVDEALHRPLDQAAAVVARSARPDLARAFLRFVTGPEGRAILARYGFVAPGRGGS
jgi:molybdate transport system substrate-binding protein